MNTGFKRFKIIYHICGKNNLAISFDIFNQINIDIPIIFTTAYDEYALKAFKLNSIDYLLKPIGIEDLKKAIELNPYNEQAIKLLESFKEFYPSGTLKKEIPAHNFVVYDILVLPASKKIVSASRDKSIKIWTEDLIFLERIDQRTGGHRHSVNSLAQYSVNQFVSVSDDKRIVTWSVLDKEN